MRPRQRLAVFLVLGALWLTGCVWLILNQFFARPGPFGSTPHPLQPPTLLAHGIIGILSLYLMGWVSARHVLRWWPGRLRRWSGGTLAAFFLLLSITGFALFFVSDDSWQRGAAAAHDISGVAVTVFAVQHWFLARHRAIRSAASRP